MRIGGLKNIHTGRFVQQIKPVFNLPDITSDSQNEFYLYLGENIVSSISTSGDVFTGDFIQIKNGQYRIINRSFVEDDNTSSSSSSSYSSSSSSSSDTTVSSSSSSSSGTTGGNGGETPTVSSSSSSSDDITGGGSSSSSIGAVYISSNNIYPATNGTYYLASAPDLNNGNFSNAVWVHANGQYKITMDEMFINWYLTDNSDGATTIYAKGNIVMDDQGKVLMPGSSEYDNWYSDPSRQNSAYNIQDYVWITDGKKSFPTKVVSGAGSGVVNGTYRFHHKQGDTSYYYIERVNDGHQYDDGNYAYLPKELIYTDTNNWSLYPNGLNDSGYPRTYGFYSMQNGEQIYEIPAVWEGISPFPTIS